MSKFESSVNREKETLELQYSTGRLTWTKYTEETEKDGQRKSSEPKTDKVSVLCNIHTVLNMSLLCLGTCRANPELQLH